MANEARHHPVTFKLFNCLFVLLFLCVGFFTGCGEPAPEPEIVQINDEEAEPTAREIRENVTVTLADSLEIELWASEQLIADPVAIDVDLKGRIWVTVTNRRRSSALDIRNHPEWRIPSLGMTRVEDKREFYHQQLSPELSDENRGWLPDYNEDGSHDWYDLTVEKDEVYLLEDLTGNSLANRSQLFYRGFNDEVTDIAGTVLNHNDELFVGASPKLWRLKDTNDDGVADHTEVVTEGYGVHITFSGHGMSGLVKGPDGRIYWGIGDFGLNTIDDEDNRLEYPHTGSIIRMEPDGSGVEVFATGLRNTHEFVFDKYGNLISVDNDGDYPGEHERLVYLIDGSDTGWRINWQFGKYSDPKNNDYNVWMNENYYQPRFDNQAAHLLPPVSAYHNGPAGMVYNPGTALGNQWKDHFFVAGFVGNRARSGIDAFTLEPNGASFNLASDKEVIRGILATGLDVGPDGSLYIADWIEGWAPNKEGWIWKMDDPAEAGSASRRQTRNLLENSFAGESGEDLLAWLGHSDMRVRMKAQFELVSRQDDEWLLSALKDGNNQLQRIHGIWGLGQLGRQQSERVSPLTDLLMDEDPEIRAQAARTLGDAGYEPAGESLIPLLADENERVRFFAAEALGRLEYEPAFTPIVEMLQKNNDEDVYLRQAGAIALSRIGNSDRQISALADHPSRAVRIAAVVALKRLTDPGITRFLEDEDEYIVTNAARAINDDDFIEEAVPDLARLLDQTQFINEPLLRRAINANLYHGQAEDARRIARFTERDDVPLQVREEAVMALSVWPDPSLLDRVTGRYRGPVANEPEHARQAFEPVALHLFQDDHPEIRRAAVEAVRRLEIRIAESQLVNLLDSDPASSVRIAALKALIELEYEDLERIFSIALNDGEISVRQTALGMIPDLDLSSADIANLVHPVLETGSVAEQQTVLQTLGRLHHPDGNKILEDYLNRMINGQVPPEIELDILEAAEQADSESLDRRLAQYRSKKPEDDPVAKYRESLYGGSVERGRSLFRQHEGAQCLKCHVVNGSGSDVGPDLTDVGSRLTRQELLEAMVNPNARVSPGYGVVTVESKEGQTYRGVLEEESATSITLRLGDGQTRTVQKSEIVERVNSPSGMPAMESILTKRELRDLVEYLTTLQEG